MSRRYFVESPIGELPRATLTEAEAHHLLHVMRGKLGDVVTLFDGQGSEFTARVVRTGRNDVELVVLDRQDVDRELPFELSLAVALPKGDRQRWLVEKLTELGVTRLIPLETERGVAQPTANALDRLRRTVVEASKQCGRNRLMAISPACSLSQLIASGSTNTAFYLAHPEGTPIRRCQSVFTHTAIGVAVGPEGGFSLEEVQAASQAGWRMLALGPRILRIETAAIAVAAWIACRGVGPDD